MIQTLALLQDAYRELQSRKMFWIIMGINLLGIGLFSLLGASENSFTFLWFNPGRGLPPGQGIFLYKAIFSYLVVGFWFTWLATLLALISTASIYPDFLTSGSIDLFLARPIGRLRLFLTKYLAGLLFVVVQVTIFTFISFIVLGIRGGVWEFGLFLAIPLVVLFFSYLYGIQVLLGVITRSTLAALLLTLLAWFFIWGVDWVDNHVLGLRAEAVVNKAVLDELIDRCDIQITALKENPEKAPDLKKLQQQRDEFVSAREHVDVDPSWLQAQQVAIVLKMPIPKTRETMAILDRVIFSDKDLKAAVQTNEPAATREVELPRTGARREAARAELLKLYGERSAWSTILTSILFEIACIGIGAWIFCKRDY